MIKSTLVISKYLPEYTGAAYRLHSLYQRLHHDVQVDVLCNSTSELSSKKYTHDRISVRRIVFPWVFLRAPARLRNAAKVYYEAIGSFLYLLRKRPQFLHVAGYSGGTMAALLYGRIYKIPRMLELVTCDAIPDQCLPGLRYSRFLRLDQRTVIVAISEKIAEGCKQKNYIQNVWCRPNPIDEHKFVPPSAEIKNALREKLSPFTNRDVVICMVAKFMPQKNQIFLIDVLAHLPLEYKLVLAGPRSQSGTFKERDEIYFESMLQRIKELNLEERVCVCAEFVEASDYIKAADVYVMPQYTEGLGTPMLEAIACGVPVVANVNEPAFVQWIREDENGYLSPMIPKLWAENIKKSIEIPEDVLKQSSLYIHQVASTAACDESYKKLIAELKQISPAEELNVSNVL